MDCEAARAALSADLDAELADAERPLLDAHVAGCADCRSHQAELADLHRLVRVRPAGAVPDLVVPIMQAVTLPGERRRSTPALPALEWARYALLAVGLTQLVLAIPVLLLGDQAGASIHVARELGSFDVALAAGLLVAAWQPRRASGLLPFAAALVASLLLGTIADTVAGRVAAGGEAIHLVDVVGVGLLWLVARSGTARRSAPSAVLT